MTEPASPIDQAVRVLVVDDDADLRRLVAEFLRTHAFEVFEASGGVAMRAVMAARNVDVVVLDVMMPGEDGLSLARELSTKSDAAIILVSALTSEADRIIGLEVGADDYLPKPASPRELVARIRAVLRRRQVRDSADPRDGRSFHFAGWSCNLIRRVVRDPRGVVVTLSHGELTLLGAFLARPQRILTREQLLDWTRGDNADAFDRAIDTRISRLRRKLATPGEDEIIKTIRNEGYMFRPKVERR